MPAALPIRQRQEIVERRQDGESFASIARTLAVSYDAVRHIYHRFVNTGRLTPNYENCRHTEVRHNPVIYAQAVALKQTHSGWGAGLIWTELAETFAETDLPSVRTLQRWFRRANLQRPPRDRAAQRRVQRGKEPHAVWALDAKEEIQLADGSFGSWLTITDEGSGAMLDAVFFPRAPMDEGRPVAGQGGDPGDDGRVGSPRKDPHG